jgi:hypothetical protein
MQKTKGRFERVCIAILVRRAMQCMPLTSNETYWHWIWTIIDDLKHGKVLAPSTFKHTSFEIKSYRFRYPYGSIDSKGSQYNCWLCLKLHLYYFEKSWLIVFNELFVHLLKLCLRAYEIGIPWIWNHLTMLLESFVIHKVLTWSL